MNKFLKHRKAGPIVMSLLGLVGAVGALWWALFALKPYQITPAQVDARYEHRAPAGHRTTGTPMQLGAVEAITVGTTPAWAAELRFASFDGHTAIGRIAYPRDPRQPDAAAQRLPVLLALHGMGRAHRRWWQAEVGGRPTLENTHLVAERALQAGHAVLALDARWHGERKHPERPRFVLELMNDLHWWGRLEPYEAMIVDTVKDYRVLLDWVVQQPALDATRIRAAGYSMGAQMALLLAGTDTRVRSVAAMVPPHLDNKVAAVAPATVAPRLAGVEVWLLTALDDDVAAASGSAALFAALPGPGHRHLTFPGGHVLPVAYVEGLQPWLARASAVPVAQQ